MVFLFCNISFPIRIPYACRAYFVSQHEIQHSHQVYAAETEGTYSHWYFGGESGWEEQWYTYHDGLSQKEWIAKYSSWLSTLPLKAEEYPAVYAAFQAEDWRRDSCGGCI